MNSVFPGTDRSEIRPPVRLDDGLHDRQAQSGGAVMAGTGGIDPGEPVEDRRLEFLRDAWTVVRHGEPEQIPFHQLQARGHGGSGVRVFGRIGKQIEQHLADRAGVGLDDERIAGQVEPPIVVRDRDLHVVHGLDHQLGHLGVFQLQRLAFVEPGQGEQILHHGTHAFGLGFHSGQ